MPDVTATSVLRKSAPENISPPGQHVRCQASKRSGVLKVGAVVKDGPTRACCGGRKKKHSRRVCNQRECVLPAHSHSRRQGCIENASCLPCTCCKRGCLSRVVDLQNLWSAEAGRRFRQNARPFVRRTRLRNGHQRGGNGPESPSIRYQRQPFGSGRMAASGRPHALIGRLASWSRTRLPSAPGFLRKVR